jgi:hypothetical protein
MKHYILNGLLIGYLVTVNLHAHPMDNAMQSDSNMMGSNMMQHMMEVTEEDLLASFNNQEKTVYQQLNSQQKALVLKAVNQFSCRAMHQKMMQQGMMNK